MIVGNCNSAARNSSTRSLYLEHWVNLDGDRAKLPVLQHAVDEV
jgi:hypothetical protein